MIEAFFDPDVLLAAWPMLARGSLETLLLSALTLPLGIFGGLVLAVASLSRRPWIRWPVYGWVDVFRAVPPLALLILLYAGLPFAGIDVGARGAVALTFLLNTGAYYGEVLRAGLSAVPIGQWDAAGALGLRRWQAFLLVALPQAVRTTLPDLLSNSIELVKLTSIASVVAVPELLFQARQAQSATYNATPIVAAALVYLAMLWPLVRLLSHLEKRNMA